MQKLIFVFIAVFLPCVLFAETIKLKSSDVIQGKITQSTIDDIEIDTGTGAPVTYYRDEIENIDAKGIDHKPSESQINNTRNVETINAEIANNDDDVINALVRDLTHSNYKKIDASFYALRHMIEKNKSVAFRLIKILENDLEVGEKDALKQARIINILKDEGIRSENMISLLLKALTNDSSDIRSASARALAEMNFAFEEFLPIFKKVMEIDREKALLILRVSNYKNDDKIGLLNEILMDIVLPSESNGEFERKVISDIGSFGPKAKETVPSLLKLLEKLQEEGKDRNFELTVIETLGELGPAAKPALPLLVVQAGKYKTPHSREIIKRAMHLIKTSEEISREFNLKRFAIGLPLLLLWGYFGIKYSRTNPGAVSVGITLLGNLFVLTGAVVSLFVWNNFGELICEMFASYNPFYPGMAFLCLAIFAFSPTIGNGVVGILLIRTGVFYLQPWTKICVITVLSFALGALALALVVPFILQIFAFGSIIEKFWPLEYLVFRIFLAQLLLAVIFFILFIKPAISKKQILGNWSIFWGTTFVVVVLFFLILFPVYFQTQESIESGPFILYGRKAFFPPPG